MSKLPSLTGERVIKALKRAGFEVVRQRGSHVYMSDSEGRKTVVPVHKGESVGTGLLVKIMRDAELTRDEFRKLL